MAEYMLTTLDIVKNFPGVRALDGVSINVKKGEVHAIVGENGAGKSTLMSILSGVYKPDRGEIYIEGQKVSFNSPHDATVKGISIVFQELSLIPTLSVAENIFTNRQHIKFLNLIDGKELNRKTEEMLKLFDICSIHPKELVQNLSMAKMQVVEILKALSTNPKVLILDEPTSSLTEAETKYLFKNILSLREKGVSILYISHHLSEIFEICDRVTILKDGKYVCTEDVKDINEDIVVSRMVGRELKDIYGKKKEVNAFGDIVFESRNITKKPLFKDISFNVRSGEIVGIYGLVGAGRTEVAQAIFGMGSIDSGEIFLCKNRMKIKSPQQAIQKGVGYLTEDRKSLGLYLNMNIEQNIVSNKLKKFSHNGFMNEKSTEKNANDSVKKYGIVTPSIKQTVKNLSGGNQQKVLLTTWVGINPKILFIDEPTRGVDVGARSEIYIHLRNLAREGMGIVMISSDILEIIGMSDRALVMRNGMIISELENSEINEEKLISIAAGTEINVEKGCD